MNLVMIAHFSEPREAHNAKQLLDRLAAIVEGDKSTTARDKPPHEMRFSDAIFEALSTAKVYTIAPNELEQLMYDVRLEVKGSDLVITTDEIDVAPYVKVVLARGARVELYSAHDHPDTPYGRKKS